VLNQKKEKEIDIHNKIKIFITLQEVYDLWSQVISNQVQ